MAHHTNERRSDGRGEQPLSILRREGTTNELSFDRVFDVLSDRRRRLALHALDRHGDSPTSVRSIAERVATWERGDGETPDEGHLERVRRSLQSEHVPRLAERALVDCTGGTGEVRYLGHPVVEEYLRHVAPIDLPE